MPCPPLVAVIPLKALHEAKGRLAPALDPVERRAVVLAMFDHVLAVCRASPDVADVLVVAGDREGAARAEAAGTRAVVPPVPGLQAAIAHADALLAGAAATLVVAADLPLLSPGDLAAMRAAATAPRTVVIAPTRDGGTGGLLRRPGAVTATAYGPGSAAAHRALAALAGSRCEDVHREGLALDVDTAGQLADLSVRAPAVLPS